MSQVDTSIYRGGHQSVTGGHQSVTGGHVTGVDIKVSHGQQSVTGGHQSVAGGHVTGVDTKVSHSIVGACFCIIEHIVAYMRIQNMNNSF